MDNPRATSGGGEDNIGFSEELRCKRSDGKQWRCSAMSMPDKTVCEKHYIQAKKRAANSALRASLRKTKKKLLEDSEELMDSQNDDLDVPFLGTKAKDHHGSVSRKKHKERLPKSRGRYSPETPPGRSSSVHSSLKPLDESQRDVAQPEENYGSSPPSDLDSSRRTSSKSTDDDDMADNSDRSTEYSEEFDGQICHQCQRNARGSIIWCVKCDRRGYCNSCLCMWYSDIPLDEIQRICPACRGICNCKACLRGDNLIKVRIREIPVQDKLLYLYCLLSSVLPVVKHLHYAQCSEVELEKRLCGTVMDLGRIKLNADEQMCCDFCRIPIIDYHRHCANCSYDLCLSCCQDLREASKLVLGEESMIDPNSGGSQDSTAVNKKTRDILDKFPGWIAKRDGSIPCPPKMYGGCGCLSLTLRRIFKMNWVAKLAKNVEEMVCGCKIFHDHSRQSSDITSRVCQFAHRDGSDDNLLYCPVSQDIKSEGIGNFREHWTKGEPVIVKQVYDSTSISSWDPTVIWRGIRETGDERMKDENRRVKAIDYLDWSEVDIELSQFIKGYSEGKIRENGLPELLRLKDWPSPSASEEFLWYQRPEFISKLPFLEYIHSKWGLLNVAAKLPHYSLQNDVGPKIFISYGMEKELGRGDSVTNLHFSMRDMVCLLVHASEAKLRGWRNTETDTKELEPKPEHEEMQACLDGASLDSSLGKHSSQTEYLKEFDADEVGKTEDQENEAAVMDVETSNSDTEHVMKNNCPGTLFDVFRRHDVSKLSEFLRLHWEDFRKCRGVANDSMAHPLFDESIYLSMHHKKKLKEEFGVEPWSFEQHQGQAVFIPAGCPFQVRNLQSTVQLSLDFLSPESLGEAVRLSEEMRCLPNDHEAKFQLLEVGKMSLYAASSAIKEVQKLVLDPKLGAELGFEDPNLTAMVSDNLEKMVKKRKVTCT